MFITFEGIEGSGKSTALKGLANHLISKGHTVICTREPGGSNLGRNLRSVLLDENTNICTEAELFLFLADRAQHVQEIIRPALDKGHFILCDRYVDSTIAYQGAGRGVEISKLLNLHTLSTNNLWPTLTLLLDVPVSIGINRAVIRNSSQEKPTSEGRFDAESFAFHEQVRTNYLVRAAQENNRFTVIDANNTPQDVIDLCINAVEKTLEGGK